MRLHLEDSRRILSQPPVKVFQVFSGEVKATALASAEA